MAIKIRQRNISSKKANLEIRKGGLEKKQPSSDPGLDLIASVHRELGETISVQENGQHKEVTKLDAFSAQLIAQSVNGKPSQQKMLLSLLTLHKHEETEQKTLEQLQSYDEDLLNDLYDQLNSMNDDTPDDINDQGDDVDD